VYAYDLERIIISPCTPISKKATVPRNEAVPPIKYAKSEAMQKNK